MITLSLLGETVGQFVDTPFVPGYTFSWSPQTLQMIAYATPQGQLSIMDAKGRKVKLESTKNVLLPAWSADGSTIAFLEKEGHNRYALKLVRVAE